jgi:hypothetical protein
MRMSPESRAIKLERRVKDKSRTLTRKGELTRKSATVERFGAAPSVEGVRS